MDKYVIVKASSASELESLVSNHLQQGYVTSGGLISCPPDDNGNTFFQAMTNAHHEEKVVPFNNRRMTEAADEFPIDISRFRE